MLSNFYFVFCLNQFEDEVMGTQAQNIVSFRKYFQLRSRAQIRSTVYELYIRLCIKLKPSLCGLVMKFFTDACSRARSMNSVAWSPPPMNWVLYVKIRYRRTTRKWRIMIIYMMANCKLMVLLIDPNQLINP